MSTKFVKLDVVTLTALPQYLSEGKPRTSCAGVYAAVVLCEIRSMLQSPTLGLMDSDNNTWVWNTHERWSIETGLTKQQVRTALDVLVKQGILIAEPLKAKQGDMTLFYRENWECEYWTFEDGIRNDRIKALQVEQRLNHVMLASALEPKPSALQRRPLELQPTSIMKSETSSVIATTSEQEREILTEMEKWQPMGFHSPQKNRIEAIRGLQMKFPGLNLLHVAIDMTRWMLDHPGETQRFLSRFGNFCQNAANRPLQFNQNGGTNGYREEPIITTPEYDQW